MFPAHHRIFTNTNLDLKNTPVIGYDMDYTLVHYNTEKLENTVYNIAAKKLKTLGLDLSDYSFNFKTAIRGLIIDKKLGNILKVCRYGTIKAANHGFQKLSLEDIHTFYGSSFIDLSNPRYYFLNTLYSISFGCLHQQLVDALDKKKFNPSMGYNDLYNYLSQAMSFVHIESQLKSIILDNLHEFVLEDPLAVQAIKDQKLCGKKIFLATNSDWNYTNLLMKHTFERHMPYGKWEDLFDLIIVSAQKPLFFAPHQNTFKIITNQNLLEPYFAELQEGHVYHGGYAKQVENFFKVKGKDILYVGDHMYSDVQQSKKTHGWKTCLIMRELENEIIQLIKSKDQLHQLSKLRKERHHLDQQIGMIEMEILQSDDNDAIVDLTNAKEKLISNYESVNQEIDRLVIVINQLGNPDWGLLLRSGKNKSHLAKQIENYADIYTSKVSNFHYETPYRNFESSRINMPHDTTWIY